jgi:hypothetical protein
MASKPESLFIKRINKAFGKQPHETPYSEKMSNPYRGGTPDVYYEGEKDCLWVEFKWYPRTPKKISTFEKLSALQTAWVKRAYGSGRNVAIIAGSPAGAMIVTKLDEDTEFPFVPQPEKDVSQWIWSQVTEKPYAHSRIPTSRQQYRSIQCSTVQD